MDPIAAFLSGQGLGAVRRQVRLTGKIDLPGGGRARAYVCSTERGLWLVAAKDGTRGAAIDLLADGALAYQRGSLSDRLQVEGRELRVPAGKGDEVLETIAVGRIRGADAAPAPAVRSGLFGQKLSELEREWLGVTLEPDETLLAWLRTATRVGVPSTVVGDSRGTWRLLLTDRRTCLVAIGPAGDVRVDELEALRPAIVTRRGRAVVSSSGLEWTSERGNSERFVALGRALELEGTRRMIDVARLNWIDRDEAEGTLGFARLLLDRASKRGDPLAVIAAYLVAESLGEPEAAKPDPASALDVLNERDEAPRALAELWTSWSFDAAPAAALIDSLRARGARAEPWARELHRRVHDDQLRGDPDLVDAVDADVAWAEHLRELGERDEARRVLEARVAALPDVTIEDLLPPEDLDLTLGAGTDLVRARKRMHEILVDVRGKPGTPDAAALVDLARLEPLVPARLERVAETATGDIAERAKHALAVLAPGRLAERVTEPPEVVRTLSTTLLDGVLRHPLAREGSALGKLLALLASVEVPDRTVLRDYCEALSPKESDAAGALANGAAAFGLDSVEGYVSRGRKAIGVRAYEGSPSFVLIGGRHFDESEHRLSRSELDFVIGAELAHLHYGHGRVTSDEVWAGAWDKSRQGLDLALGLLPVLKGWRLADHLTSRLRTPTVQQFLKGAAAASDSVRKSLGDTGSSPSEPAAIAPRNEELVAAHRVMQLTADRAGLVLAGNLGAAVRSMFVVRPDYRRALEDAEHDGIAELLKRRADDGHLAYQDLAMRTAALIDFYLSDEYTRLRMALLKPDAGSVRSEAPGGS